MGQSVPLLLINGQLVEARKGCTYASTDPYRETKVGQTPGADVADVDAAVLAASRALTDTKWAKDHASPGCCIAQLGGGVPAGAETGYFVEATVIADVHAEATIAKEDVFGLVLAVESYDGGDDEVAIANNSAFGLSGAVFSGSNERLLDVARRVRTGTMDVNGGIWFARESPFGGMKQGGLGRQRGQAGPEEYLETRVIGYPLSS